MNKGLHSIQHLTAVIKVEMGLYFEKLLFHILVSELLTKGREEVLNSKN